MSADSAQPLFEPDKTTIRQHLELLFRKARDIYPGGLCEIAWDDYKFEINSGTLFPITDRGLDQATEKAIEENLRVHNVYVGVNPRKPDTKLWGRAKAHNVEIAFFQWAEVDCAEGAQRLRQAPLPYTHAVTTGRYPNPRPHAYWELEEPTRNLAAWSAQQKALAAVFLGDEMSNPDRIMRLAGTVNHPSPKKIERGYRVERVTLRYLYDDGEERQPVSSETLFHVYPWTSSGERVDPDTGEVHDDPGGGPGADRPNFDAGRQRIDPQEYIRNIRAGIDRHDNTLHLVAHLVGTGHRDWVIIELLTGILPSTEGNTLRQLPEMIRSARLKWSIPDRDDEEDFGAYGASGRPALPFEWFADTRPNLNASDFVEDLLCESGLSVVYGESNCGKTFFMTDLAFHVATGRRWRNRDVEKGGVIYVALEGGFGIRNRLAALRTHYAVGSENIPFGIVPCSINMLDVNADTTPLIELINEAANNIDVPIRMVVIDTLARAMNGGNENAPEDMGKLIKSADRIREQTNSHVTFIHHSGKDTAKGARGHSSLRAATDTEIEITREPEADQSVARVTKQRELEISGEFAFTLDRVVLGINRRGKEVTSCVVVEADAPEGNVKRKKLTGDEAAFLRELRELFNRGDATEFMSPAPGMPPLKTVRRVTFRDWLVSRGRLDVTESVTGSVTRKTMTDRERQRLSRCLNALRDKGYLEMTEDRIWLLEATTWSA